MIHTPKLTSRWPQIARIDAPTTRRREGTYERIRPTLDRAAAAVMLVAALPIIGICWLAVRLSSPGPGFYTQTRSGRGGRDYTIVKLRTMRHDCEKVSGIQWAAKRDSRVTLVGKILRTTHLDELPQLFNVLRGEMSLVGPRPERPEVIRAKGLCDQVPNYAARMDVLPGVTGLAQVQLPADTDLDSVRAKVAYDLYSIRNRTLWLDVRIVVATAFKAAGMGPRSLRKLFLLPSADTIAADQPITVLELRVSGKPVETHENTRKRRLAAA